MVIVIIPQMIMEEEVRIHNQPIMVVQDLVLVILEIELNLIRVDLEVVDFHLLDQVTPTVEEELATQVEAQVEAQVEVVR